VVLVEVGDPVRWIERFFEKLPYPYLISALLAISIPLVYWLAGQAGIFTASGTRSWNWVIVQPLLIGLEFAGLYYFFGKIRNLFTEGLNDIFDEVDVTSLKSTWADRFYNSRYLIQIAVLLFLPSILHAVTHNFSVFYSNPDYPVWSLLFNIFNVVYYYFKLVLLAIIILILINLVLLIQKMNERHYQQSIRLNLMAADPFYDLKPLQNLLLHMVAFYFVCITLENINSFQIEAAYQSSTILPFDLIGVGFFIGLIIAGLGFFIVGTAGLRGIVRGKIESKITVLNDTYTSHEKDLFELVKGKDDNNDAITRIQGKLDVLSKQRETLLTLHSNSKGYTLQSLVEFSSAFLASIIVLLGQITDILAKIGIGPKI
jgi:hypothetical protein